jgi:hypothetical protein
MHTEIERILKWLVQTEARYWLQQTSFQFGTEARPKSMPDEPPCRHDARSMTFNRLFERETVRTVAKCTRMLCWTILLGSGSLIDLIRPCSPTRRIRSVSNPQDYQPHLFFPLCYQCPLALTPIWIHALTLSYFWSFIVCCYVSLSTSMTTWQS